MGDKVSGSATRNLPAFVPPLRDKGCSLVRFSLITLSNALGTARSTINLHHLENSNQKKLALVGALKDNISITL